MKNMIYKYLEIGKIKEAQVAKLIINRPPVNALNDELANELTHALRVLGKDKNVRVVLVCSVVQVFIAGADIAMMKGYCETKNINAMLDFGRKLQAVNRLLEEMSKPTIAVINGHALGGGFELALWCDFRFIAHNARVGLPEIKLGLLPGAGGVQKMVRMVGYSRALRLMLEGKQLSALEAYELGLVEQVCAEADLLETAIAFAEAMAKLPVKAVTEIKNCANVAVNGDSLTSFKRDLDGLRVLFETEEAQIGLGESGKRS
jgi:enoyl-CoA hydratase